MNDYETGMEGMRNALSDHDSLLQGFTRKMYADSFRNYYMSLVPAMDAIENLYASVIEKDTMLENMAERLVNTAAETLDRTPKRNRERVNINLSLAMAAYLYPTLLKYGGVSSRPLVDHISARWKEAFPKSNITPAEYDVIESGFHRKFCFITTACCRNRNKPDDCYELTLLRSYRDHYLASLPDGEEQIRKYYDVAPSIVKHIDRRPDADRIYDGIWKDYIQPCIHLIEQNRYEECRELYEKMVADLKKRYFYACVSEPQAVQAAGATV